MAVFNSFTFDGRNSLDSGVYITGQAVFNAPERVVEMVTVPGRNGAIAIDQGRFENIEVTYPAGCFAESQQDFAEKIATLRNELASRYTYKRLTDTYNPDEFRLGLYRSGLETSAVRYNTAGEFDIVFDCKPQRFLIDGDRAISPTEWSDLQTESGELVTIESDGSLAVKSFEISLEPIQAGSGEPSPSNVRAISGRTEVVTHRTGKNVCGISSSASATYTSNGITWTKVDDSTIHVQGTATAQSVCALSSDWSKLAHAYLPSGTYRASTDADVNLRIGVGASNTNKGNAKGGFAVTLDTADDVWIGLFVASGTTINKDIHIQLEQGSTATTYEPYNGQTYTTALGRTVYGGTLDVVSGVLTVDRAMVSATDFTAFINGSSSGGLHWVEASVSVVANAEAISSMLEWKGAGLAWGSSTECFATENEKVRVYTSESSLANFKTKFADLVVVYELATPQTYQLTPQQIELLLGENHLWSDGEITVTYGVHPYYNPTPFESKPLIKVTGKGVLQIGDYVLTIVGRENQTIYIDCESQEAWEVVGAGRVSRNDYIQNAGEEFPVLVPGINNISLGSGITAVTITPRWWRI